ncbi:hypothetical protein RN001_011734 [Aquatica leii]|uniref:Wolframin n=1 Tax=Aquatica leii TaxID=1421715 RepID=A0AAN7SCZ0_9COLE|nr:hypothetical protein RN001_011734 [Aquatica leii]
MAGVVPTKKSTSGRKQWTIHDGPRGSLKRLRNQLANDGCPESQVVLAKQLLEEQCDVEADKRENDRLGVYWLMKSSEQGNTEATDLLRKCFLTGKGITEHNFMDVKSCIDMTQGEKLARKAARELFASLSNGEDYVTSQQLQRRILEIDKEQGESRSVEQHCYDHNASGEPSNGELNNYNECSSESEEEIDWSQRLDEHNEKLTEENLVSAAVDYSHGHLPLMHMGLSLSIPNLHALDNIPVVHRSILHPFLACKILYYKLIRMLGCRTFYSYIPSIQSDIQWILIMCLYSFVSSSSMLHFIPMVIYYVTFSIMALTTFQLLQSKHHYQDFQNWSTLFLTYSDGSLNAAEAEYQFIRNNLKPYAHFFIALIVNLIIYPVISDQWIPQSELTIFAFCLTFMTLHSFMIKERGQSLPDFLTLFSFAVNVLAKYPYETDAVVTQGWRFLDLKIPTFASYVIGNGIEFCINFRVIFYVLIPLLFVVIASRQNWKGTYKCLIPHCVTLSWLQIAIINSQGATTFGLMRGTLALVGVVMFLPLVGLTTIILPSIALTKWVVTSISYYSLAIFLSFTSVGLGISWLLARTRFKQQIALLQVLTAIATFFILINSFSINNYTISTYVEDNRVNSISWDQYQNFCHEPAWETDNVAVTQMRCSKLVDVMVEWNGYINEIKIKSISNFRKRIFDHLPAALSQYLYCYYGEPLQHDCNKIPDILADDCLMFYDAIKSTKRCSLEKFNTYQFEILVRMQSGIWGKSAEVVLDVNHYFKNFTLGLKPNDHIKFKGLLINADSPEDNGILGGLTPHVSLQHIQCVACHNPKLTEIKLDSHKGVSIQNVLSGFYLGVKFVLNFLFQPIIVFR